MFKKPLHSYVFMKISNSSLLDPSWVKWYVLRIWDRRNYLIDWSPLFCFVISIISNINIEGLLKTTKEKGFING